MSSKSIKKYIVEARIRTGIAKFKTTTSVMEEDQVKMSFPSWKGETEHKVGNVLYIIRLISPEI